MATTFRKQKNRCFTQPLDVRGVHVAEVAKQIEPLKKWLAKREGQTEGYPEKDALWFYLKNHVISQVGLRVHPDEDLGPFTGFVENYHHTMQVKALRMYYYLLLICTREARHLKSGSSIYSTVNEKYGAECGTFLKSICASSESQAVGRLEKHPPATTMGQYTEMLEYVFNHGSWSGGYGGKAWGAVAKILRQFVHGEISAELMLDTAFTLCHNNGPIFNKGMLFEMYTEKEIVNILDVQRSGQIPELVLTNGSTFVDQDMRDYLAGALEVLGNFFGEYVDWFLVEASGAVGNHKTAQKAQIALHGLSPKATEVQKEAEALAAKQKAAFEAKKLKELEEQEALLKGSLEIMPGMWVKKLNRSEV